MKRKLVLLTNQYPFTFGDHAFVRHEIDALAEQFDEVVVFNYSSQSSAELAHLPANVVYAGNLHGLSATSMAAALLSPSYLVTLARTARAEAAERQLRGHLTQFFKSALTGMVIARDRRLRSAVRDANAHLDVYCFWGMGAALSVPWLPRSVNGISIRLHRYDLYKDQGTNGYLPFRAALFARARAILSISAAGKDYLLATHPQLDLQNKLSVSRLGSEDPLPPDAGPEVTNAGPEVTDAAFDAKKTYTIVSCSNLIPVKRVDKILAAVAAVDLAGATVQWIHFGGGPLESELRAKAREMAREGLIVDFVGATANQHIQEFYAHHGADLFINASSSEGIPVSIMEAISYDIPVLATNVGGTSEIVGPGLGTGELLDPEFSQAACTAAIEAMLSAPPGSYQPHAAWAQNYRAVTNSRMAALVVSGRKT